LAASEAPPKAHNLDLNYRDQRNRFWAISISLVEIAAANHAHTRDAPALTLALATASVRRASAAGPA
jgi:hypothetical protein